MKKLVPTMKKYLPRLMLGCALVVLAVPALVSCKDRIGVTVTFSMDGGIPAVKDKIVETGKLLTKPTPEPTKEGYTFAGWFKDKELTQAFNFSSEKITDNITLYAKWLPVTYTVTFNYNNGGTETDLQQQVNYGKKVSAPTPTKTGYTFSNWYSDATLTTMFDLTADTITQDTTLYAKWVVTTYTVTFNLNDDSPDVKDKIVEGGMLLEKPSPDPTKEGYTFTGWYSNEGLTQAFNFATEKITQSITLYAKWKSHLAAIPDYRFKARLKQLLPDSAFVGDSLNTMSDHVTGRTHLNLTDADIKNLTGIEYFTGLTKLDGYGNNLTELDVSANTALTHLNCSRNNLTGLDVSKNVALEQLNCSDNKLLDLDVSNNTRLTILLCGGNRLTSLDLSNNTQLIGLSCHSNELTGIDVSGNTALTQLNCSRNNLTGLDVSANTALTTLSCSYNQLTNLDMRGMRSVTLLYIHHTPNSSSPDEETNVIDTLKVHVNLKDYTQISAVKTAGGDKVTIETYSATAKLTEYTLVCSDYDPTEADEQSRCKKEAP